MTSRPTTRASSLVFSFQCDREKPLFIVLSSKQRDPASPQRPPTLNATFREVVRGNGRLASLTESRLDACTASLPWFGVQLLNLPDRRCPFAAVGGTTGAWTRGISARRSGTPSSGSFAAGGTRSG